MERLGTGNAEPFYARTERWASPYINHFLQPDTIIPELSNPQSWNRYSYVRNSPIRYNDPTGHIACVDDDCNQVAHPITGKLLKRGKWKEAQNYRDYFAMEGIKLSRLDSSNKTVKDDFTYDELTIMYQAYKMFPGTKLSEISNWDYLEGGGNGDGLIAIGKQSLADVNGQYFTTHGGYLEAFRYTFTHEMAHAWAASTTRGDTAQKAYTDKFWRISIFGISLPKPFGDASPPTAYADRSANEGFAETVATYIWSTGGGVLDVDHMNFVNQYLPFLRQQGR